MAKSSLPAYPSASRPRLLVQRPEYIHREPGVSLGNLWQMPLLLLSLGAFAFAAWVLVDPQPAAGFQRQLAIAERDLEAQRYDAVLGLLNDVLLTRPEPDEEIRTRLLIAQTLDRQVQRSRRSETPLIHRRVIEETQRAYSLGFVPNADTSDRLARSFEALGELDEAAANYQRAIELLEQSQRAGQAVPMRKGVIEMLVANERHVAATEAIKGFLNVPGLADDERAWALGELARIHTDAGRHVEARSLLTAAMALSPDDAIRGQVSYRLGYSAWKLGDRKQAQEHLEAARRQLGPGHPLDAEACYLMGLLAHEREDLTAAAGHFEVVVRGYPQTRIALRAQLARANVRITSGEFDQGAADLLAVADEVERRPSFKPIRAELLGALQRAGRILATRERYDLAIPMVQREQAIDPESAADCLARRCRYSERLVEQLKTRLAAQDQSRPGGAELRLRDTRKQAAVAHLEYARLLSTSDEKRSTELLRRALSLYEASGDTTAMLEAMESFAADFPQHPATPEALVRMAIVHGSGGDGEPMLPRLRQAWQIWMKLSDEQQPTR